MALISVLCGLGAQQTHGRSQRDQIVHSQSSSGHQNASVQTGSLPSRSSTALCVSARTNLREDRQVHCIYIYIHIYSCISCVCIYIYVCVDLWDARAMFSWKRECSTHTYIYIYTYSRDYMYIYMQIPAGYNRWKSSIYIIIYIHIINVDRFSRFDHLPSLLVTLHIYIYIHIPKSNQKGPQCFRETGPDLVPVEH